MSIQAVGYVGAALIAASAAFVGLVLGKEQKTTEFRQAWIDAQRKDLAAILSISKAAVAKRKKKDGLMKEFDEAHGRILLRENPDKDEWSYVLDEIERLRLYAFEMPTPKNVDHGCRRIVARSRVLLKIEWNRVRAGERWFVLAKAVLPPAILFVALALAYGRGFIVIQP